MRAPVFPIMFLVMFDVVQDFCAIIIFVEFMLLVSLAML